MSPDRSKAKRGHHSSYDEDLTMECWRNMTVPVRKAWTGVATRLGIRKTGIVKLKQDVQTCEYEDVRVLWEMLQRNESELTGSRSSTPKRRRIWNMFECTRQAPYLCRSY